MLTIGSKMIKNIILSTSIVLLVIACNPVCVLANANRERTESDFDSYVQWRNEELAKLKSYLGFTKEQIREAFGKPDRIIDYLNGEFWDYDHYVNKKKVGFFRFYFEQEKVVKVDIR